MKFSQLCSILELNHDTRNFEYTVSNFYLKMATATTIHDLSSEGQPSTTTALADLTAARNDGKVHLLLAASGSVATIKIPNIISALHQQRQQSPQGKQLSIRLILTSSAANFLHGQAAEQPAFHSLPGLDGIYLDDDEWGRGATVGPAEGVWRRGGSILHIELRRWAHVLAIVPLSANTLAKIVNGICDNLLTSVVRAWDADGRVDGTRKRILVAPAMNVSELCPPPSLHFKHLLLYGGRARFFDFVRFC